jgi:hypothetical protein
MKLVKMTYEWSCIFDMLAFRKFFFCENKLKSFNKSVHQSHFTKHLEYQGERFFVFEFRLEIRTWLEIQGMFKGNLTISILEKKLILFAVRK